MTLVLADRVQETTTTTGTGTVALGGAVSGFQSFAAVGNGNTTYYTISGGAEWEVGIGTYTSAGATLSRTTVLASSNAGALVNFSAGTKSVFVDYPAGKSVYKDASGNVGIGTASPPTPLSVQAAGATTTSPGFSALVTAEVVQPNLASTAGGFAFQYGLVSTNSGSATTTAGSEVEVSAARFYSSVSGDTNSDYLSAIATQSNALRAAGVGDTCIFGYMIGASGFFNQSSTASTAVSTDAIGVFGGGEVKTGTVTKAVGLMGHVRTASGGSGTVTAGHGLYTYAQNFGGTYTTYYDAYLAGNTAGTVANKFGLYQASATHTNYFAGSVGIGTTAPGSALDVKGTLRLSGSSSGYVGLAPAAAAGSTTYTLPSADGSAGQVLSTDGAGTLSWASGGSGSGISLATARAVTSLRL